MKRLEIIIVEILSTLDYLCCDSFGCFMISLTISIITITTCVGPLELSPWLCTCVVFIFSAILVVRVPFPFGVWGRMWNSIVSVPDHCLFIYFAYQSCCVCAVLWP